MSLFTALLIKAIGWSISGNESHERAVIDPHNLRKWFAGKKYTE